MVLAELGGSIAQALKNLTSASTVDEKAFTTLLNSISKALLAADVEFALVVKLQKNIKAKVKLDEQAANKNLKHMIHSTVVQELYNLLDCGSQPYQLQKGKTNVVMFVGLQGAGKTTTVTKYAHYYQRKGYKTGLVCADTFRAGAFDQLKQNATAAKIPFYGSYTELDPVVVAEAGVALFKKEKYDLVIIDTSGRHKQESALFEEMQEVSRVTSPDDIVFVMDGSIGKSAKDQALAFRGAVDVGSVIITKLDGHAKGGGALSAVAATQSPIIFIGTGEHMTDFEAFSTKSFVQRLLGMGDIGGLINLVQDSQVMEGQAELVKKLTEGKNFSLKDMYNQLRTIMKLAPMGQLMSMMPQMPGMPTGPGAEKEAVKNLKRMTAVLDSMNSKELDSDGKPFEEQRGRVARVAKGSGVDEAVVEGLLQMYGQMSKMMNSMGGMAKGMGGMGDMSKLVKNGRFTGTPQQAQQMQKMQQNMKGMFDPNMMRQMQNGGMPDLGSLMSSLGGGGGGMPDLGSLMSSLGGGGGGMPDLGALMNSMGGAGGMAEMMKKMGMGGMFPPGGK